MSRSHRYILAAAAIAISTMGCASQDSSTPPDPTTVRAEQLKATLEDPNVVARLRDLALEITSSSYTLSPPAKMYVVAVSDHQAAETVLSGAIINDHAAVYVIVMTGGRFTANMSPPGVPAPEGSVLTVTLDAATLTGTDSSIGYVEPDLSQIALATVDLGAP